MDLRAITSRLKSTTTLTVIIGIFLITLSISLVEGLPLEAQLRPRSQFYSPPQGQRSQRSQSPYQGQIIFPDEDEDLSQIAPRIKQKPQSQGPPYILDNSLDEDQLTFSPSKGQNSQFAPQNRLILQQGPQSQGYQMNSVGGQNQLTFYPYKGTGQSSSEIEDSNSIWTINTEEDEDADLGFDVRKGPPTNSKNRISHTQRGQPLDPCFFGVRTRFSSRGKGKLTVCPPNIKG